MIVQNEGEELSHSLQLFGKHHISVDVGADVELWGPEFGGKARINLHICHVTVSFGASRNAKPAPIGWGDFSTSFLPQSSLNTITVSKGLVSTGTGAISLGIVNPKTLAIVTDAFIPTKTATWGNGSTSVTGSWNSDFGIGPMDLGTGSLTSTQRIAIRRVSNNTDATGSFKYTTLTKKAPAGLWGKKLLPAVNDQQFIDNTLAGLEITPASGPQFTAGEVEQVDRDFVQYETTNVNDAIELNTSRNAFVPANLTDDAAKAAINNTVVANAASRDTLLTALGVTDTIDLNNTLATDYITAPQIM